MMEGYKCISSSNDAANYAKVLSNGDVEVITLYRYAAEKKKVWTKEAFIAWQNDIYKTRVSEAGVESWGLESGVDKLGLEVA